MKKLAVPKKQRQNIDDFFDTFLDDFSTEIATVEKENHDQKPVDLETFLYSTEYLNLSPDPKYPVRLSQRQLDFLIAMDDDDPTTNKYTEAVLLYGKGAGKDWLCGIFYCRRVYKLLCIASPAQKYGLPKGEPIDFLNVAPSADAARDVFFAKFVNMIENAGPKCFKQFGFDKDRDIKQSKVVFPKNITVYSGHSQRASLEGKNLFAAIMDESSEFYTEQELVGRGNRAAMSGPATYDFLRSSIRSRFPQIGKLILISYPRFVDDFTIQKFEQGKNLPSVFTDHGTTWEINPLRKKDDFKDDYLANPERAKSMYECIPPEAEDPFIRDYTAIEEIIDLQQRRPLLENGIINAQFRGTLGIKYAIGIDLSLKYDKTALVMLHKEQEKYIIDYIRIWRAQPGKEIQIKEIEEEIYLLQERAFKIEKVVFDQFQSSMVMQSLDAKGIDCEKLSVESKLEFWNYKKELIQKRLLKAYYSKETEEYLDELKKLVLLNGKKVDHQGDSQKDCSDAVLRAIVTASKFKNEEMTFFQM